MGLAVLFVEIGLTSIATLDEDIPEVLVPTDERWLCYRPMRFYGDLQGE